MAWKEHTKSTTSFANKATQVADSLLILATICKWTMLCFKWVAIGMVALLVLWGVGTIKETVNAPTTETVVNESTN